MDELTLIVENASTELKKILRDALYLGYSKTYAKSLVYALCDKTTEELKEKDATETLISSTINGLKQTFIREWVFILEELQKASKTSPLGFIGEQIQRMQPNLKLQGQKGIVIEGNKVAIANVENVRDLMTINDLGAGGRYIDYATELQRNMIRISNQIADGTLSIRDSLGRHKSIRNMSEIETRFKLITDDFKRMGNVRYVIASSHADCSKRCEPFQGKIYLVDLDIETRPMGQGDGSFKPHPIGKIDGKDYYSLKEACEHGFLSFNCQHRLIKYYTGIKPVHYDATAINKKRDITTKQRQYENVIRKYKAREVLSSNAKIKRLNPFTKQEEIFTERAYNTTMSKWYQEQYVAFSKKNNAPIYEWRTRISEVERNLDGSPVPDIPPIANDGITFAKDTIQQASKTIEYSDSELQAVEGYVSGNMMWINNHLRGLNDTTLNDTEKVFLNNLREATSKADVEQKVLYRSVDASAVFGKRDSIFFENLRSRIIYDDDSPFIMRSIGNAIDSTIGKEITDKGFMSTTTDKTIAGQFMDFTGAENPIILELAVPEKTKGFPVYKFFEDKEDPQKEVLLHEGVKYRIDEITSYSSEEVDSQIYVKATIIE